MSVLRTVSEEPCCSCGRLTNAYDPLIGRICPACLARISREFRESLERYARNYGYGWSLGIKEESLEDPELEALARLPLIDHSNDIDAHLHEM